jgi:hypothetical protein
MMFAHVLAEDSFVVAADRRLVEIRAADQPG